jgi:hypothetical protein
LKRYIQAYRGKHRWNALMEKWTLQDIARIEAERASRMAALAYPPEKAAATS